MHQAFTLNDLCTKVQRHRCENSLLLISPLLPNSSPSISETQKCFCHVVFDKVQLPCFHMMVLFHRRNNPVLNRLQHQYPIWALVLFSCTSDPFPVWEQSPAPASAPHPEGPRAILPSLGETCCPPGVMEQHTGPTSMATLAPRYQFPFSYGSSSSSTGTNHPSFVEDGHFSKPVEMSKVFFFFRRMKIGSVWLSTGNKRAILGRA